MKLCEQLLPELGVGIYQGLATDRFDHHILDVTELVERMVYGKQAG